MTLRRPSADPARIRTSLVTRLSELPAPAESLGLEVEAFGPPAHDQGLLVAEPSAVRRRRMAEAVEQARQAAGPEAALRVLPRLSGGFCFVMMDERTVFAARDPHGIRPLSLGRLPSGGMNVSAADLARAAAILREGGLVAFPTETVYGLGANALDPRAVARIFDAKGRPAYNPLIVHVADADAARALVREWPDAASRLASALWPGPLTLVMRKPKG